MMDNKIWKFSLLLIFVILVGGQMTFYMKKLDQCNDPTTPTSPACDRLLEGYQSATDAHLQTILALMVGAGAGAAAVVASGATQRDDTEEKIQIQREIPPKYEPAPPPNLSSPPEIEKKREPDVWNNDGPWVG